MHPIHIPRTRKKAFRVQWIIFEFIAPSFQSAETQPASISECWNASKTNFRVLETNLKVLKTNFKVLKVDFRVLEPNFKVPKLEKAKIRSVLFVSQFISVPSVSMLCRVRFCAIRGGFRTEIFENFRGRKIFRSKSCEMAPKSMTPGGAQLPRDP